MTEKFFIHSLDRLLKWIVQEYETRGAIFGISKELFFKPSIQDEFRVKRYGQLLETPLGTAAGPQTQSAQNIISAWLAGARYIELKTVQTLENIAVTKPCIHLEDEGYNCEWSQELKLNESFEQYLDAWIIIHILRKKFGLQEEDTEGPGFIFNMSVGYDLKGIQSRNIQDFLDKMENCRAEKEKKIAKLAGIYPEIKNIAIPDRISNNVTLSTMHGCPAGEIEDIARYLLEDREYHTTIKLNPTLLGKKSLKDILNNKLGYDIIVPDEAFAHDLKYEDALKIIANLRGLRTKGNQPDSALPQLSLKLTNTLETLNQHNIFSHKEKVIYMSGKALHPIAVNLAARLQEDFNGELDISFCGGADCFNISQLLNCGLYPVTVCSDILKPGGYTRLCQYLEKIARDIKNNASGSTSWLGDKGQEAEPKKKSNNKSSILENLKQYAQEVIDDKRYHKNPHGDDSIKTARELNFFDCITAPCSFTCPANQEVPRYMFHTAQGDFAKAFEVILKTNPFPTVTGMVCDHQCVTKCTRINYDNPLQIRDIKRFIADHHERSFSPEKHETKQKFLVAVIGAGPAGLSCAYFLALYGCKAEVYEARSYPGGMAAHVIPRFRLRDEDIKQDIRGIEALGVKIHYDTAIDREAFNRLRKKNDFIYIAAGAQGISRLNIPGEDIGGVGNALSFLAAVRRGERVYPGKRVAVVGGGNSAIDAARAALRLIGKSGEIFIIYRRTRHEMPASAEEVEAALSEGIKLMELTAPTAIKQEAKGLELTCVKMKLGEPDASGRRRPLPIENSQFSLTFDSIIYALGQQVELDFLDNLTGEELNNNNIYIGGDALHGPSNIISAIADGRNAALKIIAAAGGSIQKSSRGELLPDIAGHQEKAGRREYGSEVEELAPAKRRNFEIYRPVLSEEAAVKEAARCLSCDSLCNVCVSVCPNRANVSYSIEPTTYRLQRAVKQGQKIVFEEDGIFKVEQQYQVLNVADFCNECGNCRTFCPTKGSPYKDKPRLCLTKESFALEDSVYFIGFHENKPCIKSKFNGKEAALYLEESEFLYRSEGVTAALDKKTFIIKEIKFTSSQMREAGFRQAAEMSVLLQYCPPYLFPYPSAWARV
jgi:putative selenate reductase